MSFCLRSIPNKFTSLVNTCRQVTKLDHQLLKTKRVKSFLFLKEVLDMQTKLHVAVNSTKTVNSLILLLGQNTPGTFFNNHIKKPKICNKKYNFNYKQTLTLHQQKEINVQAPNLINSDLKNAFILKNKTQGIGTCMTPTNRIFDNISPSSKVESVLYSEVSPSVQQTNDKQPEDSKSSEAQLQKVYNCLQRDLPLLFVQTMDYSIYTKELVFINNIKGTMTTGIHNYVKQIALLKIVGHLKFAYVKCDVLKMTMHPEDSTVKVRWRIEGISGASVLFTFWRYQIWNIKDQAADKTWYDGFSTFYVNNEGKVFKHIVDKMIPDQDHEKVKTPVEPKLALFSSLSSSEL